MESDGSEIGFNAILNSNLGSPMVAAFPPCISTAATFVNAIKAPFLTTLTV